MTNLPANKIITNPVEALVDTSKENSELHEELRTLQAEHYWYVKGLQYISEMPNEAGPIATLILQKRAYRG